MSERLVDQILSKLPFSIHGYTFTSMIGHGAHSYVLKAIRLDNGRAFAAKIVHCTYGESNNFDQTKSEVDCLLHVVHPNVIKFFDRFVEGNYLFMILELCSRGSIDNTISENYRMSECQTLILMKQLICAVQCCHCRKIAHRNINPSNIYIAENGIVKLGGFRLGIHRENNEKVSDFSGSFLYHAPEVIKKEKYNPFMADIWSLGVTLFYIATGAVPWDASMNTTKENILSCNYSFPESTPESVVRIIRRMIVLDPSQRATTEQLLSDPIFFSSLVHNKPQFPKMEIKKLHFCLKHQLTNKKHPIIGNSVKRLVKPSFDDKSLQKRRKSIFSLQTKSIPIISVKG